MELVKYQTNLSFLFLYYYILSVVIKSSSKTLNILLRETFFYRAMHMPTSNRNNKESLDSFEEPYTRYLSL